MNEKCHYCDSMATTRDHIVPKVKGGRNARWNLVPSCRLCNQAKGASMPSCRCNKCLTAVRRWKTPSIEDIYALVERRLKNERCIIERLRMEGQ